MFQQFLNELFEASPNYSLPLSLQKLRAFGGISKGLLNSLAIDHRQITNVYKNHEPNREPLKRETSVPVRRKKASRKQPELQNILLYLITLSFFVKVLLFDNQMTENLNIYTEVISFVFLIFIMIEKKSRTKSENVENTVNKSESSKKLKIRRNGYEKQVQQDEVLQGDMICIQEGDTFQFDGIILQIMKNSYEKKELQDSFISVNEEEVGTGRNKCKKHTIWKIQEVNTFHDPFVLANSKVLSGSCWVLVCLTSKYVPNKRNCSELELGGLLKLSNLTHQVQKIMRFTVVLLVGYLSLVWVAVKSMDSYDIFLQLIYLISCLTLYLSYANTSEIIANLRKYLKQTITGKGYKILNHKLLEKLGEVDLIIIQDDCLSKNIELLTKINNQISLKIVTNQSEKQLQSRFGGDLNHQLIFQHDQSKILRQKLEQLAKCKFISISYEDFRSYYLQIFKEMQYCMVYMSRSREAIGKYENIITIKCSNMDTACQSRLQGEWIRISQGECAERVILELIEKAKGYRRFQQGFYTVVINNCLELAMLIGWALTGCLVDLNLNLIIIFTNRNRVKQFYETFCEKENEPRYKGSKGHLRTSMEINIIFLFYYIYMNWEIYDSTNREFQLFLVLMANRMFRIEALLREKHLVPLIKRLLLKSSAIFLLIIMQALLRWELGYASDYISQSLDILLLPLILLLFVLFL